MVQAPRSFIVRQECEKAAWQHGFRRPMAAASEGWAAFASTTVPGNLIFGPPLETVSLGSWLRAMAESLLNSGSTTGPEGGHATQ